MAYAIINTGGGQYRVAEGDTVDVDLLDIAVGKTATFGDVLLYADGKNLTHGEVIGMDGKRECGSGDKSSGRNAIHMVSAWASQNHLVLGQVKVNDKSNEIRAMPELLKSLDIEGCIVTIDGMGCQKEIAQNILDAQADYVLSVKKNQGRL